MANLDLSTWSWDDIKKQYPDIYQQAYSLGYVPGAPGYTETTTPTLTPQNYLTPISYDARYGGIPQLPDPRSTAGLATQYNLDNLAKFFELGGGINQFNVDQSVLPYKTNLPKYLQMMGQQSGIITDQLAGMIPADVRARLGQAAAERGIAQGFPGSGNVNAALMRALGLTSLDLQEKGMTNLQRAIGEIPTPALWDISSQFLTPEMMQNNAIWQALLAAGAVPRDAADAARKTVEDAIAKGTAAGTGGITGGRSTMPSPAGRGATSGGGIFSGPLQGGSIGPLGALGPFSSGGTTGGGLPTRYNAYNPLRNVSGFAPDQTTSLGYTFDSQGNIVPLGEDLYSYLTAPYQGVLGGEPEQTYYDFLTGGQTTWEPPIGYDLGLAEQGPGSSLWETGYNLGGGYQVPTEFGTTFGNIFDSGWDPFTGTMSNNWWDPYSNPLETGIPTGADWYSPDLSYNPGALPSGWTFEPGSLGEYLYTEPSDLGSYYDWGYEEPVAGYDYWDENYYEPYTGGYDTYETDYGYDYAGDYYNTFGGDWYDYGVAYDYGW